MNDFANNAYNRNNYYNQKNWKNFVDWKKQKDADNPWDAECIKPPSVRPVYVRHTNKCLQSVQNPLNRLSRNNDLLLKTTIEVAPDWHKNSILQELAKHPSPLLSQAIYHNLLYRAKQLTYLQPIFELFLDPPCKGLVYISTLGKKFWVIGTTDAHAKANFNSNQKTFRVALEGYLKFKNPKFVLPPFHVVHYRFSFPVQKVDTTPVKQVLSEVAQQSMQALKTILQTAHNVVRSPQKHLTKPFIFKQQLVLYRDKDHSKNIPNLVQPEINIEQLSDCQKQTLAVLSLILEGNDSVI